MRRLDKEPIRGPPINEARLDPIVTAAAGTTPMRCSITAIRNVTYFGRRGKILNVHFRNIKGRRGNFQETFPDDGDVDMIRALRVYKEVGYDGMIMPDHVPQIEGDVDQAQAFAFAFGYIQALIQLVGSEA